MFALQGPNNVGIGPFVAKCIDVKSRRLVRDLNVWLMLRGFVSRPKRLAQIQMLAGGPVQAPPTANISERNIFKSHPPTLRSGNHRFGAIRESLRASV